jgi:hypothetical protein
MSQTSGLTPIGSSTSPANRSQFATGSQKHRDPPLTPLCFHRTRGAHGRQHPQQPTRRRHERLCQANSVSVFQHFRFQRFLHAAILRRLAEIDKTLLVHDVTLREILQKLRPLLEPPPQPPKPEIGFHVKEDAVPYRVRNRQKA